MRALCDAIVVGAATIRHDNPQLTTRRVTGDNPVRVVLDSQRRLTADYNVFQDGAAATLVFCDAALAGRDILGNAQVIGVPLVRDRLQLSAVLEQLHARDLYGVFIEGGGITVSYFLQENLLDQLQIAIAPLLIGSGRPGITLPVIQDLNEGLRPTHRLFTMGDDILFDCALH
jgi:riboflavin-specific deaminase-like protein